MLERTGAKFAIQMSHHGVASLPESQLVHVGMRLMPDTGVANESSHCPDDKHHLGVDIWCEYLDRRQKKQKNGYKHGVWSTPTAQRHWTAAIIIAVVVAWERAIEDSFALEHPRLADLYFGLGVK